MVTCLIVIECYSTIRCYDGVSIKAPSMHGVFTKNNYGYLWHRIAQDAVSSDRWDPPYTIMKYLTTRNPQQKSHTSSQIKPYIIMISHKISHNISPFMICINIWCVGPPRFFSISISQEDIMAFVKTWARTGSPPPVSLRRYWYVATQRHKLYTLIYDTTIIWMDG